jgi:nitrogen-specific signal transduction histidine kinase
VAADPRSTFRPASTELAQLLDGLATCVLWLDADGAILHLNEPAEDLFAVSRNQAAGRSVRDLLKGNVELEGVISRARAAGAQYSRRELPFEAGPAAPRPVDLTVTLDPADIWAWIVEIADATQHSRIMRENALLAQLGGSRAMVRQLAHEIKNPLGGLRGAAQLLERELHDGGLKEYTSVIISEADRRRRRGRLARLGQPLARSPKTYTSLQHVGQPSPRRLRRCCDRARSRPEPAEAATDRNQTIQALLNLGRNAIQAGRPAGASCCERGAHERQYRQPPLPRRRKHPGGGRRARRADGVEGHGSSAGHGGRAASVSGWPLRRTRLPPRRPDRVRQPARPHRIHLLPLLTTANSAKVLTSVVDDDASICCA